MREEGGGAMSKYFCDPCAFEECQSRGHFVVSCPSFVPKPDSNYDRLFGTPERAAQLIVDNCEYLDYCGQCWIRAANCDGKYSTVLEWLRGDA